MIQTSESSPKCDIYHEAIKIYTQPTNNNLFLEISSENPKESQRVCSEVCIKSMDNEPPNKNRKTQISELDDTA